MVYCNSNNSKSKSCIRAFTFAVLLNLFMLIQKVGYGDTYPTSAEGKIIASLAMLMGVLVIAFPGK